MGPGPPSSWLGDNPEWMQWANCRDTDPDVFFPDQGGCADDAKRICSRCSVDGECLDYALRTDERFGVWGGLTDHERRRLKRRLRMA